MAKRRPAIEREAWLRGEEPCRFQESMQSATLYCDQCLSLCTKAGHLTSLRSALLDVKVIIAPSCKVAPAVGSLGRRISDLERTSRCPASNLSRS